MKLNSLRVMTVVCALSLITTAEGALISVTDAFGNSNISIVEGTASVDVYVRIAQTMGDATDGMGNSDISNVNLRFAVGDGGPVAPVPGTDMVPITAVTFVGTGAGTNASVWQPQSGSLLTSVAPPLPASSAVSTSATVGAALTNVQYGPGITATVLARITLDTSGLMAGDSDNLGTLGGFLLNPTIAAIPTTALRTQVPGGAQIAIPLTFDTGVLSITAIPEPGSFLLLSLGAVGAVAGRRYRRRTRAQKESTTTAA